MSTLNDDFGVGKRTRQRKGRLPQSRKHTRENNYMRISWNLGDLNLDSPNGKAGKDDKSSTKSGKSKSDKTSPSWTSVPSWPIWPSWASSSTSPTLFDQSAEPSTENPSQTPTVLPSKLLSTSPTITVSPTVSPVQSPSASPTITLSSVPSTIPSISPTARPSIDVTSLPSTTPSVSPSIVPTNTESILPTLQASSPKPSVQPSITPTGLNDSSRIPTTANGTTPLPTYSPTNSSEPVISYAPSPSLVIGTTSPTAEQLTATRQDLKMSLFGLPNALLDASQQQYYQRRTGTYIEDFYNNDDGTNGILEAIKSEITNVTAILTIANQKYEDGGGVTDGTRMIPISGDDEDYLPEFAVTDSGHWQSSSEKIDSNNRLLQATTQVTEPCVGTSSLKITFSLELSFKKTDSNKEVDSNAIIFFPFSAVKFRTNYIDNYLKNPQFDDDEILNVGASAVFSDVYCTSRVVDLAETESPTSFPTKSSGGTTPPPSTKSPSVPSITSSPSLLNSVLPSPGEPATLIPSLQSASSVPSTRSPSTSVSFSPSSISSAGPTAGSGGSSGPTNSTRLPTIDNSLGPTTIPQSTLLPVGSTSPTLILKPNVSSIPSGLNGSNAPSSLPGTSLGPSTIPPRSLSPVGSASPSLNPKPNVSSSPSDFNGSNVPSSLQGTSLGPTTIQPSNLLPVGSESPSLITKPNVSSSPTNLTRSNVPTLLQGASTGPTTQKPTTVNSPSSAVPSTVIAGPSRSPSRNNTSSSAPSATASTDDIFTDNNNSSSSPTGTRLKSTKPSTDDIFINLRMINNETNERKCNGEIRPRTDEMEEFELSFAYGVESSSNDVYELTDDLENIILDFLAARVLVCASERDVNRVQRSQYSEGEIRESGVVRIRYPEYGEITSIADCDPFISSRAKSCAIMNTKLLVTSVDESKSEARHDILLALTKAFNENKFGESIPSLSKTSYIGPDPESLTLSSSSLATMLSTGGTPRKSAIAVSMGCSLVIFMVALCLACRRSSTVANAIHSSRFSRGQHEPIPTQEEEAEKGLEVND